MTSWTHSAALHPSPESSDSATTAATARAAPAIEVEDVTRRFGRKAEQVHALGPLDLEISSGDFVTIVGPSGCGKSTLLRVMAGLVTPSNGAAKVHVYGGGHTPVAMVFQDYSIFPWKTVEQNVRLGLDVAKMQRKEAKDRASMWIDRLGLSGFEDSYPATLSGGMKQRVSIARALAVEPEILLMDEPFAALDAQRRALLQEELLALWESDRRTVVFVTHALDEAIMLSDRVVVMTARPGRLLADIRVPFGRPRSPAIRGEAQFAELQQSIWEMLKTEVQA